VLCRFLRNKADDLLIDNYDSFTYNLVQRFGELDATLDVRVFRNNQITPDKIEELRPSHIIISPGPARRAKPGFPTRCCSASAQGADAGRVPGPSVHRHVSARSDSQFTHHARQDVADPS